VRLEDLFQFNPGPEGRQPDSPSGTSCRRTLPTHPTNDPASDVRHTTAHDFVRGRVVRRGRRIRPLKLRSAQRRRAEPR
jgi:hypothetical protein